MRSAVRVAACVMFVALSVAQTGCGSDESSVNQRWDTTEPDVLEADVGGEESDVGEADTSAPEPDVSAPEVLDGLEVRTVVLPPNPLRAGQTLQVECQLVDVTGEPVVLDPPPAARVRVWPQTSFEAGENGALTAARAGQAQVGCVFEDMGLFDAETVSVTIEPGDAHSVVTHLERHTIVAGESVAASCEVYDAFGNAIVDAAPELALDVSGDGLAIEGMSISATAAGVYEASCLVAGAPVNHAATLEVMPALPAQLLVARMPDKSVYAPGEVVEIVSQVTDRYGNEVGAARVEVTSTPAGEPFGTARYRYANEGIYTVDARVDGPTEGGVELSAQTTIVVNGTGPELDCVSPFNGQMISQAPGTSITVRGRASDTHGIGAVTVNGQAATVAPDGTFTRSVPVRQGINFLDIVAQDGLGEENVRTCAFLASSQWLSESGYLDGAVSLRLAQSAIDDTNRAGAINSFGDLLHTMLSSRGLRDTLHQSMQAANPLKDSCDQTVFGACVFRTRIEYLDSRINGPHTVNLSLVPDGLRIVATVRNFALQARVSGTPPSSTGWADLDYVTIDLTSNLRLQNGQPRVTLRQVNNVQVGSINLRFSGFTGFVIDIIETLFSGTIRNMIRDQVRNYIQANFNQLLDGIVSSLDISSLGTSLAVPRLDGSGAVNLSFAARFSSLGVSSSRALFGLGVRLTAPSQHSTSSRGVASPQGTVLLDPSTSRSTAIGVHVGVINQALHALWRAGFFDASLGDSFFGGSAPEGVSVTLRTRLPPVAVLQPGGKLTLQLGGLELAVRYPGLFDTPLALDLGATAQSGVALNGNELRFANIRVDELHFSPQTIALNAETRAVLEDFLRGLVQGLVDESLNGALPALPIPTFELPASVSQFGLPAGREVGITSPLMNSSERHVTLEGNFGLR